MSEYDTHNIYSFNAVTNPTVLGPLQEIYLFPTLVYKKIVYYSWHAILHVSGQHCDSTFIYFMIETL